MQGSVVETDCQDKSYIRAWKGQTVADFKTKCAHVQVLDTEDFGLTIFLDGEVQSSAVDQEFYHEALVAPAFRDGPKHNILIVGGGECATLYQVLKQPGVEKVTMVDYDGEFVAWCKEHLTDWHHNSWADERVTILHEDIYAYLDTCDQHFDAIIVDMTDISLEFHPEEEVAFRRLAGKLRKVLADEGTLTMYIGMWIRGKTQAMCQSVDILKSHFDLQPYRTYVPTFGTGEALFACVTPNGWSLKRSDWSNAGHYFTFREALRSVLWEAPASWSALA
jgi:spermidine synthase